MFDLKLNDTGTALLDIFEKDAFKAREKFDKLCKHHNISLQIVGCFFGVSRQAIHSLLRAKQSHKIYNDDMNEHTFNHIFFNLANALIIKYTEITKLTISCDLYISVEDAIDFNKLVLVELPAHLTKYIAQVNNILISLETKKGLLELSQPYKNKVESIKTNINDPTLNVAKKIHWLVENEILSVKRVTAFLGTNYDNFRRKIHATCTDEFLSPNEYDICVCFLTLILNNAEKLVCVDGFGLGKRKFLSFVEDMQDDTGVCADLAYNIRTELTKKD